MVEEERMEGWKMAMREGRKNGQTELMDRRMG